LQDCTTCKTIAIYIFVDDIVVVFIINNAKKKETIREIERIVIRIVSRNIRTANKEIISETSKDRSNPVQEKQSSLP